MEALGRDIGDDEAIAGTPEDVAALYLWAHLQGAKYRDFSASRREYRAQVRYRAAKAMQERELREQAAAESAAWAAEEEELEAMAAAQLLEGDEERGLRMESLATAEEAAGRATALRLEAIHRSEAAAHAAVAVQREEREIAAAQASARQQALRYAATEERRRLLAGPQPLGAMGGVNSASGGEMVALSGTGPQSSTVVNGTAQEHANSEEKQLSDSENQGALASAGEMDASEAGSGPTGPAWLYTSQTQAHAQPSEAMEQLPMMEMTGEKTQAPGRETLQDSKERVASRWFALKGLFEEAAPEMPAMQRAKSRGEETPLLALFSLAGGVGKTSLAATLGRSLSLLGERVVLMDATLSGLLPYYFGEREVRPGEVRNVLPREGSQGAPISLTIRDASGMSEDKRWQEIMTDEVLRNGTGNQRMVLDLSSGSSWLLRRLADLHPVVLVPVLGDMNSVIGLHAVERIFRSIVDSDGRALLPYYVVNQFDGSLPLHLDVREVLRRQLGERLLRAVIRRSPAVSEALAEGMTVVDYEPGALVSLDYMDVAGWLRTVSPPAKPGNVNRKRIDP